MNDQEFGDHIAELVSIRATLDPVDFSNRAIALANLLTIDRHAQTEARVRRLLNTQDEVADEVSCQPCHALGLTECCHIPAEPAHRRDVTLPDPECYHGYPITQVRVILSGNQYDRFFDWMSGQTVALCEGKRCDTPHGGVVYSSDLLQYLNGGQPLD